MSVTRPTLKLPPLDEPVEALVLLLLLLGAAAAPPLELVVLLLLPHAVSPIASAAVARVTRPTGLILPVTRSPFRQNRMGNHSLCAGQRGSWPNVLFTNEHDRPRPRGAHTAQSVRCRRRPGGLRRRSAGVCWRPDSRLRPVWRCPGWPSGRRDLGRPGHDPAARVRRLPRALSPDRGDRVDGARAAGMARVALSPRGGAAGRSGVCGGGGRAVRAWPGGERDHDRAGVRLAFPGRPGGFVRGGC